MDSISRMKPSVEVPFNAALVAMLTDDSFPPAESVDGPPRSADGVNILKKQAMHAKKQYIAVNTNTPRLVKGRSSKDDKQLPQNETLLTSLSLLLLPHPGTMQGHRTQLTMVNSTDGIPKTRICKIDSALAPHMAHGVGSTLSWSCRFAQPLKFHHRKCSGNAPSSLQSNGRASKWTFSAKTKLEMG